MDRFDRGEHEFRGLIGAEPQDTLAELRLRSPQMYDLIIRGMGVTMAQAELSRTAREIATVAMLVTIGAADPQLDLHTRAALNQGVTPAELIALCEHVAMYAGVPRALNGLAVIDRVLADEGFPRPAALRRVRLTDHETFVAQRGAEGPPVVLVHAIGLDWRMWEPVMAELADTRRVFAYDVRGHGLAMGAPAARTTGDLADDLVKVLDELALDRAHVVGLSFGGAVAQATAVAYPERIASLALLGTTDQPAEDLFESRARAAEKDGMAAQVPATLPRWFTTEALAVNGWGVQYARERLLRGNVADWAASWRVFKTLDVQGKLGSFPAPALVVAGSVDVAGPPEAMRGLAGRIAGARFEELPGTPHMMSLERPELVARVLGDFIE
ncbi:alpha/beta fold hydrolase [Actinocrispum wychmicini]|uniref:3-oxoadipate enol-lactonase n=1 Tax=Actinocrispum wychmicini TaxID=1213861 RepID=A0A4R2K7V9_9PSEU|nr:alpha/beta fold hydrolase [Actinocrispum wychmicini]TCO65908.1 3-oxoadipate enol-lactonase [Actinocrispum wychmicini]